MESSFLMHSLIIGQIILEKFRIYDPSMIRSVLKSGSK